MENYKETLIELTVIIVVGIIAGLIRKYCLYHQEHINNDTNRDRNTQ